jgi:hypothetical protein
MESQTQTLPLVRRAQGILRKFSVCTEDWQSFLAISALYQLSLIVMLVLSIGLQTPDRLNWSFFKIIVSTFDGHHYLYLAQHGYQTHGDPVNFIVFLPLYPVLTGAVAAVIGSYVMAGLIVSNLFSICGHTLLLLFLRDCGYRGARLWRTALLIFLTPTDIYYVICYTEGLYIFCVMFFSYALLKRRFLLSGCGGMLGAYTKLYGSFLGVAYAAFIVNSWFRARSRLAGRWPEIISGALLIALGLASYLAINFYLYDNTFKFLERQNANWYKHIVNPFSQYKAIVLQVWNAFREKGILFIPKSVVPTASLDHVFTIVLTPLMALYAIDVFRRREAAWAIWAVLMMLVICSQSYWQSNTRYIFLVFPVFMALERYTGRTKFYGLVAVILCSAKLDCIRRVGAYIWAY